MPIKTLAVLSFALLATTASVAAAATLTIPVGGFPGTGVPLTITGSDGNQFTFSGDSNTQFEGFMQGGTYGQFAANSTFLSTGLDQNPITISFADPVRSFSLPAALQQNFDYTIGLKVYDGSLLVRTFPPVSVAADPNNGFAPATVFNFTGPATSAVLMISTSNPFGNPVIGSFSYNVAAVPLPAAAPMFGAALVAFGLVGFTVNRKGRRAAA